MNLIKFIYERQWKCDEIRAGSARMNQEKRSLKGSVCEREREKEKREREMVSKRDS